MTPERELVLNQATACRQLALISDPVAAAKLKSLADDYEAQALIDREIILTAKRAVTSEDASKSAAG
jgi:hypothetical protein